MNKFSWLLACFFTTAISAQQKLVIKGKVPNQYVVHAASGTETLQSISNGFGLSVTKLSAYNKVNINASASLAKGTEIKIPLTKDNLLQRHADNSEAVIHVIGKGDNLYRVSQAYYKVPLALLREWNHLKKDVVKNGQEIIVGYMANAKFPTEKKTEAKKEVVADNSKVTIEDKGKVVIADKIPAVPPVVKDKQVPVTNTPDPKAKNVSEKPPVTNETKKDESGLAYLPKEGDEGYFAASYAEHPKEQTQQFHSGDAATFKTISGWTDRKFYVLMNDVPPKTVVRITGTSNKSICAMVLGPLQETKGTGGLLLRLSNSAASALGSTTDKFTVTVTYFE